MEGLPKKDSGLEKAFRASLAGAAIFGAVAVTETPANAAPLQTIQEQKEIFSAEREANAFLEKITLLDAGIDDARGRKMLRIKIEEHFSTFALALDKNTPYFSSKESVSLSGSLTPQAREKARQYLFAKIQSRKTADNPALEELRRMMSRSLIISPEMKRRLGDW